MKEPYEAIVRLLAEARITYERIEHEPVFTSEQAAQIRGMKLSQGAKSLLLKTKEGDFVLVVMPGDTKLNSRALKEYLRTKSVRFATPEEVKEQMGCEIGACYPLGRVAGLRTIVDNSLSRNKIISFNPGRHDVSIKLAYGDYQKLAMAEFARVAIATEPGPVPD